MWQSAVRRTGVLKERSPSRMKMRSNAGSACAQKALTWAVYFSVIAATISAVTPAPCAQAAARTLTEA